MAFRPTKVLVVDDSVVIRSALSAALSRHRDIDVVGSASDVFTARDLILQHNPEVMTLDVEMPRTDGLTFLRKVMDYRPMPVIVVGPSSGGGAAASIEALHCGAIEVLATPVTPDGVDDVAQAVVRRIRALRSSVLNLRALAGSSALQMPVPTRSSLQHSGALIVLGSSSGGARAVEFVLSSLPADTPPVVIAQHMPAGFTRAFADRLDAVCQVHVREAKDGDVLQSGHAYVAPGERHLTVEHDGARLRVRVVSAEAADEACPSLDVLFRSAAKLRGVPTVSVVFSGLGKDGVDGMRALRLAGAQTLVEHESSAVAPTLPREAAACGAALHVVPLLQLPGTIADCLDRSAGLLARPVAS